MTLISMLHLNSMLLIACGADSIYTIKSLPELPLLIPQDDLRNRESYMV